MGTITINSGSTLTISRPQSDPCNSPDCSVMGQYCNPMSNTQTILKCPVTFNDDYILKTTNDSKYNTVVSQLQSGRVKFLVNMPYKLYTDLGNSYVLSVYFTGILMAINGDINNLMLDESTMAIDGINYIKGMYQGEWRPNVIGDSFTYRIEYNLKYRINYGSSAVQIATGVRMVNYP